MPSDSKALTPVLDALSGDSVSVISDEVGQVIDYSDDDDDENVAYVKTNTPVLKTADIELSKSSTISRRVRVYCPGNGREMCFVNLLGNERNLMQIKHAIMEQCMCWSRYINRLCVSI